MIQANDMLLWLMFLGSVLSAPTDEFGDLTKDDSGDSLQKNDRLLRNIVPSGHFVTHKIRVPFVNPNQKEWSEVKKMNPNNIYFKTFTSHIEKGYTAKGLTFNIYDDNMREAAVALFRLFQNTEGEVFEKVRDWAEHNINKEMYMYALRLESLYNTKTDENTLLPPFIWNPHYFVNSEALTKASLIIDDIRTYGKFDDKMSTVDQYSYTFYAINEFVTINTNYSGWNLPKNSSQDNLNYFREDVSLNSYYLGLHLLYPFWMSNDELDMYNSRYAEHYYYAHQQLMARYELEKLHLKNDSTRYRLNDGLDYIPYLSYKNGLPFPTRSCIRGDWEQEKIFLKSIDIAIRECISRGLIIMQNGTTLTMKDDNHINILAKLIRANLDGVKVAKIARSIVGYGGNTYPIDEYNPAPSILHHPETSLRDPSYWFMIQHMLRYFTDYKKAMKPYDLSQYESDDIEIIDSEFSKLTTYFDYYKFIVNYATSYTVRDVTDWPAYVTVRQRRMKHVDFSFNFTVESAINQDTVVRLYLGPECGSNCWDVYSKFYELDTFLFTLQEGLNLVHWSPEISDRFSYDYYFDTVLPRPGPSKHSIFKFPENLLIPRGLEQGLNLTLFIMITPTDNDTLPYSSSFYREITKEFDSKPLGFPFHRQAEGFIENAPNYRFYNISIYHKQQSVDDKGYFSSHLY